MPREKGSKNRNYPPIVLADALRVAREIQDQASGMAVSKLTLAEYLDTTPSSSVFRDLVMSSRGYGLTEGGAHADEFSLTPLGDAATGADEVAQQRAFKQAVMNVPPYKVFFDAYSGKKFPATPSLREFLAKHAEVSSDRLDECVEHLKADAAAASLTRTVKGAIYVDLEGVPVAPDTTAPDRDGEAETPDESTSTLAEALGDVADGTNGSKSPPPAALPGKPKKVFIAHGKNHTPLDQLKKALDQFKVQYAVAINEPNAGRPISKKVANLMRDECSSGIFIFTADERFLRETKDGEQEEVWRPSENIVYELGAASILYENRIVIFKEKSVSFPSDFSDLGYIEFEKDQLVAEMGNLFSELVALDILEVRAKG
ncbi:MAG: TIR domain-containing protein [Gaiellaceae bacterium]